MKKWLRILFASLLSVALTGCIGSSQESIVNSHAEALLTNKNELQFRFKLNDKILSHEQMYKVKVSIHNEELASALGTDEIIYGADSVSEGEYIKVSNKKGKFIFMDPVPLNKDLHVFELEEMIVHGDAVSVEVFHDGKVIARGFLNNFSSQF